MQNTRLHDKLKYNTIENRVHRLNHTINAKIRLDLAYKIIYIYDDEQEAYLFYSKFINKTDLVQTLNDIIGR